MIEAGRWPKSKKKNAEGIPSRVCIPLCTKPHLCGGKLGVGWGLVCGGGCGGGGVCGRGGGGVVKRGGDRFNGGVFKGRRLKDRKFDYR